MINVQAVAGYLASQPGGSGDSELVASLLTIANTIATSAPGSVPSAASATPGSLAKMLEAHTGLSAAPGSGSRRGRPSSGGVARPTAAEEDMEASAEIALAQGIRMFVQRYPVDTRAYEYLVTSSSVVVAHVLRDFRPQREGDADYSSLVTSYVKRVRGMYVDQRAPNDGPANRTSTGAPGRGAAPPPWRSAGAAPTSASVLPKAPRSGGDGGVPRDLATALATPGLDEFFSRFPIDERAYDYFVQSSPEVQDTVLREFQVRNEGEKSYAGLFTSFVKKCRMGSPIDADGRGHHAGSLGQLENILEKTEFDEAVQEMESLVLEDFRARFPMDDRAFQYLCGSPKEVQDKVRESFVPQRLEDTDFSAAVTAYVKTLRRQFQESQGGSASLARHGHEEQAVRTSHKRKELETIDDEDRKEFFERWPCDARALDYFDASPAEVQAQVILEFKPRSEGDADYSAAVTAFIKRCRYPDKGRGKGKPGKPGKPDGGWGPKRPRFS